MNLGGMEAIAQQVAGKAILDHAKETEQKLVRLVVEAHGKVAGKVLEKSVGKAATHESGEPFLTTSLVAQDKQVDPFPDVPSISQGAAVNMAWRKETRRTRSWVCVRPLLQPRPMASTAAVSLSV